ncbi:MAG: ABC transporter ATP-binding protein [Pseudomonadota bacterium]
MADLVQVEDLSKNFVKPLDFAARLSNLVGANQKEVRVQALDAVSLTIRQGEVLGIVGESGCGKSTLGRVLAGIHKPSSGRMLWKNRHIAEMRGREYRDFQLRSQMIFQDPSSSLNPRQRISDAVSEAPIIHGLISKKDAADYTDEMLRRVAFDPGLKDRYPHQFSGGQRQRIGIARALAVKPEFLVCDESIAALDVSIQAQVINLFLDLKDEFSLTYAFISHDLSVVRHIADRVAVMYLGRVVETGTCDEIFGDPKHPYTRALLREAPNISVGKKRFTPLKGEVPSPLDPPRGCHFHPRCDMAQSHCQTQRPTLDTVGPEAHVACFFPNVDTSAASVPAVAE